MKLIDRKEIRETVARGRARGNIASKNGRLFTADDKVKLDKRAEHTPYADKLFKMQGLT